MPNLPDALQGTYVTKGWTKGEPCLVLDIEGTTVTTTLDDGTTTYKNTLKGTLKDNYVDTAGTVTLDYTDAAGTAQTTPLIFTKATKADAASTVLTGDQVVATMKDGGSGDLDKDAAKTAGGKAGTKLVRSKGPAMKWYMALVAVLALFGIYWGYNKLEHRKRR